MQRELPIGVFDSGLGGLSILKALRQVMPAERYVYLGDVARLPYGTKSSETVRRYAESCARFLLRQEVKAIVVACNTATATALGSLKAGLPVECFGVIEAGVRAGRNAARGKGIVVLGTQATVKSGAYLEGFRGSGAVGRIQQVACPLLVPLAEEGWFDHPVTVGVIQHYLSQVDNGSYDTLVLGCTHYPLLQKSFERAAPGKTLVHAGPELAREVRSRLDQLDLLTHAEVSGEVRFFTTDSISPGLPIPSAFFGTSVLFERTEL